MRCIILNRNNIDQFSNALYQIYTAAQSRLISSGQWPATASFANWQSGDDAKNFLIAGGDYRHASITIDDSTSPVTPLSVSIADRTSWWNPITHRPTTEDDPDGETAWHWIIRLMRPNAPDASLTWAQAVIPHMLRDGAVWIYGKVPTALNANQQQKYTTATDNKLDNTPDDDQNFRWYAAKIIDVANHFGVTIEPYTINGITYYPAAP